MKPSRPILRYHGGKWKLAEWIMAHFPEHRIYVEPFGGGGSVLLRKQRSYAEVYNDLDGEVVNVFRVLQSPSAASHLAHLLAITPFARAEFNLSYEPVTGDSQLSKVEQARRTLLRSFMGFGSAAATGFQTGFRSNSNRSGTTPAHDWTNIPQQIEKWAERLRGVVIENKNALELIPQHDTQQTLFYVDPPYPLSTRKLGNPYCGKGYRHEMTDDQHRELAKVLKSVKGMVVLSGYPSALYNRELYWKWDYVERAALADGAKKRTEVLWLNDAAASATPQLRLENVSDGASQPVSGDTASGEGPKALADGQ